jgi:hypothetical protein
MLTLLCCVLAHIEHTRLEDITEVHILEWKAMIQEVIERRLSSSASFLII